jgi:hypothetical protein
LTRSAGGFVSVDRFDLSAQARSLPLVSAVTVLLSKLAEIRRD